MTRWVEAKHMKTTTKEMLEKLTDNADLQTVLSCNWADVGIWPSRMPSLIQPMITKHYLDGAFSPRGGTVIRNIVDFGGKVLVSAKVKSIFID